MGAGKSSIARLIDYCLGGKLDYTPALQSEFVAATIKAIVGKTEVLIQRERGSNQVRAQWEDDDGLTDLLLPARRPEGIVLPDTEVEVLSDLLFFFAGVRPPRVRRSKTSDDSELQRLSFRDLFWYCYLDQDTLDSEFFHLDPDANYNKRNKSRDVLRFILGFHQERVAELEAQLEETRLKRSALSEGAKALLGALQEADVASENEIEVRLRHLKERLEVVRLDIGNQRSETETLRSNAVDKLRHGAKNVGFEIVALEDAITSIETVMDDERQNMNEFATLSIKMRRDTAARAVLGGVAFENCPRCAQTLPNRESDLCPVCGQTESVEKVSIGSDVISADIKSRQAELTDSLERHKEQVRKLRSRLSEFQRVKGQLEAELNSASVIYDSAYLSSALALEREAAMLEEQIQYLERLQVLPKLAVKQLEQAEELTGKEESIRRELRDERASAEKDTQNLRKLERLFLDCLVRAKIPGFSNDDIVTIGSPYFLPEVAEPRAENLIINSFANLGSGGKKTLYKACFAIALHRLAVEVDALLPTLLIIDSPMKNISERVNREQFEGFHYLLYELAQSELSQTQFVLIDKEYLEVPKEFRVEVTSRHMAPNSTEHEPLISYFGIEELGEKKFLGSEDNS